MTNNYINKYRNGSANENNSANLVGLPARLDAKQAAQVLGFLDHDIPVLVARGLLKPLGKPVQNARKYFATVEISELADNPNWLGKATLVVSENWKTKNANRAKHAAAEIALAA